MPKVILVVRFRQVLISAEGVDQSTMDGRYRKTSDLYNAFYRENGAGVKEKVRLKSGEQTENEDKKRTITGLCCNRYKIN